MIRVFWSILYKNNSHLLNFKYFQYHSKISRFYEAKYKKYERFYYQGLLIVLFALIALFLESHEKQMLMISRIKQKALIVIS